MKFHFRKEDWRFSEAKRESSLVPVKVIKEEAWQAFDLIDLD